MSGRTLTVKVVGNDTSAKRMMSGLGAEAHKTGGMFGELKHHAVALAAGFVGFELLHKGAEFLKESTEAAKEDQAALALLANQSNKAGVSWKKHGEAIEETITKMSEASGFMKSDLITSFSALVTATHSQKKATTDLGDAENIARARHIDLGAASKIMIKANMGNVGALKKLGIEITAVTSHQDALKKKHDELIASGHKMTQAEKEEYAVAMKAAKAADKHSTALSALAQIHKTYAGASEAYSNTAEGQLAKLGARWEMIKVQVGNHILPLLGRFAAFLTDELPKGFDVVGGKIREHEGLLMDMAKVLGAVAAAVVAYVVVTKTVAIATEIYKEVSAAIWLVSNAQLVLNAAMDANPIGLIIVALTLLAAGFYLAYTRSATFRNIVDTAFAAVKNAASVALGWITNVGIPAVIGAWNSAQPVVQVLANIVKIHFAAIKFAVQTAVNIIKPLLHGDFAGALDAVKEAAGKLLTKIESVMEKIPGKLEDAAKAVAPKALSIGEAIVSGILGGLGGLYGKLVSKLESTLKSALANVNPFSPVEHGGEIYIGRPLMQGAIKGITDARADITKSIDHTVRHSVQGRAPITPAGAGGGSGQTFVINHSPPDMNVRSLAAAIAWQQKSVPA